MISRIVRIAVVLSALALATPAHAVQRTFVSSHGDDLNPCSIMLPCRAFAAAIAQTSPGGEVVVLDSAGYGTVTITQSVSIIAPPGVYAGISVPPTAIGVLIATPGVRVVLRGLTINSTGGAYGIRMTDGAELIVENCVISNFGVISFGVIVEAAAMVAISGSVIRDNAHGIVAVTGSTVNVANSQVLANSNKGIAILGGLGSGTTRVSVSDTVVSGSSDCILNLAGPSTVGQISLTRVTITACGYGILNAPAGSGTSTVGFSMISDSVFGFAQTSGTFYSLGNNLLSNNAFDTTGSITTLLGK